MLVDPGEFHGLIFGRLRAEHREIRAMLGDVSRLTDAAARFIALSRLARAIRVHDQAEEEIVFPVLDGSYELGHHVRDNAREHRAIDELLRAIEEQRAAGEAWRAQLDALRAALDRHFADEEDVVFPRARAVIGSPEEQDLLIRYEQEREFLTRPR